MEKLNSESKKLMEERFGRDSIIALATLDGGWPCGRGHDLCVPGHLSALLPAAQTL